jgi:hypothetical protein
LKPKQSKRQRIYDKYGGRCAYCGELRHYDKLTLDHIKPESKGGTWRLGNLNPSCYDCNKAKDSLTIEDFRHLIECKGWITSNVCIGLNRHWKATLKKFEGRRVVFYFENPVYSEPTQVFASIEEAFRPYTTMAGFGFSKPSY